MFRVLESARVQHDAQRRECPDLQVCTLDHWNMVNTLKLPWAYIVEGSRGHWTEGGVGIRGGLGLRQGQFPGCLVCSSSDPAWNVSGPVM